MCKSNVIKPVEEMSNLAKRLGKTRVDRIRYAGKNDPSHQKGSTNIKNTVLKEIQYYGSRTPSNPVDDYIVGAANLDTSSREPLNITRIYNILQTMPLVNTREIMKLADISERQSQKYLRAVKFIMPHLEAYFAGVDTEYPDNGF